MNFKNKRVFISGGAGVIGSCLVERLISEKAIVFVGDLKPCPSEWSGKVIYRQGDLNYILKGEIEKFKPEYFFHLAATFERTSETYDFWEDNFHNNILLSHYLMGIFKEIKSLTKVIFASSYLIYDPDLYLFKLPQKSAAILAENSPIRPRNLVGMAKLAFEAELEFLAGFNFTGFSFISARIYRSYGKNSRDVISRWVRQLIKNKTINVYAEEGMFDYVYAGDVAEGLIRLAKTFRGSGVVNLASGKARKISDILSTLKGHFPKMRYKKVHSEINKFEASRADMSKYYKIADWKPKTSLEKAISEIVSFEKRRKSKSPDEIQPKNNILITSLSEKIPLLAAVKKALHKISSDSGIVIGADSDKNCVGKHFVDKFWKMPILDKLTVKDLINYCKKESIKFIIPTRDGELSFFAENKKILERKGVYVMVSELKGIEACRDKLLFYELCKKSGLPVISTSSDIDAITARRFVVKDRFGSGSRDMGLNLTKTEAIEWAKKIKNPIFQPFILGREASIDGYIGKKNKLIGIVSRWRDLVVDGESKITSSFHDDRINKMVKKFIKSVNLYGPFVMQVLIDDSGAIKIIECNPRFGGASTLSLAAGLDSFYWFMVESSGGDIFRYTLRSPVEKLKQIRYKSDLITSQ